MRSRLKTHDQAPAERSHAGDDGQHQGSEGADVPQLAGSKGGGRRGVWAGLIVPVRVVWDRRNASGLVPRESVGKHRSYEPRTDSRTLARIPGTTAKTSASSDMRVNECGAYHTIPHVYLFVCIYLCIYMQVPWLKTASLWN